MIHPGEAAAAHAEPAERGEADFYHDPGGEKQAP
jgi:hypothetical protein